MDPSSDDFEYWKLPVVKPVPAFESPPSPGYSSEDALKNTVVLREIFKFLPMKALLNCSVVNKTWNFEARSFIRDRRECTVKIAGGDCCSLLRKLDAHLGHMSVIPFTGLKVTLGEALKWTDYKKVEMNCVNLFIKLPLRYLGVTWNKAHEPCLGQMFVLKMLECYGGTLEKLMLDNIHPDFKLDLAEGRFGRRKFWLPKLKVLELGEWDGGRTVVTQIFDISPNLRRICGSMCPRELRALPENKYKLLDEFRVCVETISDEQVCNQLAQNRPTLREMIVDFPRSIQVRLLPTVLEKLLVSSQSSLEKLTLDSGPFITLGQLSSSFPPLKKLKHFTLISHETTERLLDTLRTTDYAHLLPSLESVQLFVRPYLRREWDPPVRRKSGNSYPCKTVKVLELETDGEIITLADMKNIFPNVIRLRLIWEGAGSDIPFEDLFRLFPTLTSLDLTIRRGTEALYCNFDAAFCGLTSEEAYELRSQNADFLKKVQIVPIRPCLGTMLRLKTFRIVLEREPYHNFDPGEFPDFLSLVSETLAFSKMPQLAVTISNNDGGDPMGPIKILFYVIAFILLIAAVTLIS